MADPVTLAEQIACVQREIGMRRLVYARQMAKGKMSPALADREIRTMEAALVTLQQIDAAQRPELWGPR